MRQIALKDAPVNSSWGGHHVISSPNLTIVLPQRSVETLIITLYGTEFMTGPTPQRLFDEKLQKKIESEKNEKKKLQLAENFVYGTFLSSLEADDMALVINAIFMHGQIAGQQNLIQRMKESRDKLHTELDDAAFQQETKVRKDIYARELKAKRVK